MSRQVKNRNDKNKKKPKRVSNEILPYCPYCREYRKLKDATTLLSLEKVYNEECIRFYPKGLETGWSIQAAAKRRLLWACDSCLESGYAISAKPWLQILSMANPEFCYSDKSLKCSDCGKDFLFLATEQQYWYEVLQFGTYSSPKQCVQCRRKRRIFKKHFHDLQRALEIYDSSNVVDLAQVATFLYSRKFLQGIGIFKACQK